MKVKVRTKQGGFRDDRVYLTTKWQDFEESELSATWIDNPNIEIKTADGKFIPTPDPGEATTVIGRPGITLENVPDSEPAKEEEKEPDKPAKDKT